MHKLSRCDARKILIFLTFSTPIRSTKELTVLRGNRQEPEYLKEGRDRDCYRSELSITVVSILIEYFEHRLHHSERKVGHVGRKIG